MWRERARRVIVIHGPTVQYMGTWTDRLLELRAWRPDTGTVVS